MKRQTELDLLRLAAFLAVVSLHVNSAVWSDLPLWSPQWLIATVLRGTWAVPVFVMLSGRFFLDPERRLDWQTLGKKMLRLLAGLLFWGIVYQLYYFSRDPQGYNWKRFVAGIATGAYHMWFLWMLLGLYAVTPQLRRISSDRDLTAYFLLLHSLLQTVRYFGVPLFGCTLEQILDNVGMQFVLGYSGYFLLGYYLHSREFTRKQAGVLYGAGMVSWVISFEGNLVIATKTGAVSEFFTNYQSPLLMVQAAAVYVFFAKGLGCVKWREGTSGLLAFTARHGFGAYLAHALVNEYVVALVGRTRLGAAPWLWMPLTTLLVAAGSILLAAMLRKLPKIGKWVA